jgi:predicted amidophosphoribosyltransferase
MDPDGRGNDTPVFWVVITALAIAPIWMVAKTVVGVVKHQRTKRPSFPTCPRCCYDLTRNTSGVCPECGYHIMIPHARIRE